MKKIYLHIGTHKTGTTSIQRWLADNKSILSKHGIDLYKGIYKPTNHIELYLASLRYERNTFHKQMKCNEIFNTDYTKKIREQISNFLKSSQFISTIFTTEGLSLLRHADECKRLADLFDKHIKSIKIILYLRNKKDFLTSYKSQLNKNPLRKPAKKEDYWSGLYVEDDTYLINYDSLIDVYSTQFGRDSIQIIDYDKEMKNEGNVIPSFISCLDLNIKHFDSSKFDSYKFNKTYR